MTDLYAVFGNPIAHSVSPEMHRAFALQTSQHIVYEKTCVAMDAFEETVREFFKQGGKGLNVTMPFKQEAFGLSNKLSDRAASAGAVNTLIPQEDGSILGENTDGIGLINDMKLTYQWTIKGKNVLVLGAGGAVRGILQPLLAEKPAQVLIYNRTFDKAQALRELFPSADNLSAIERLKEIPIDVIINGTSSSLQGGAFSLPGVVLAPDCCCYDMAYGKDQTPFLTWAENQGVNRLADGLGMLVHQGAEAFRLWRGVMPETQSVIRVLRDSLASR